MKDLIIVIKILGCVLILCSIIGINLMGMAIASSSHNISSNDRDQATTIGNLALILGTILIISIWLPWKKWFTINRK